MTSASRLTPCALATRSCGRLTSSIVSTLDKRYSLPTSLPFLGAPNPPPTAAESPAPCRNDASVGRTYPVRAPVQNSFSTVSASACPTAVSCAPSSRRRRTSAALRGGGTAVTPSPCAAAGARRMRATFSRLSSRRAGSTCRSATGGWTPVRPLVARMRPRRRSALRASRATTVFCWAAAPLRLRAAISRRSSRAWTALRVWARTE